MTLAKPGHHPGARTAVPVAAAMLGLIVGLVLILLLVVRAFGFPVLFNRISDYSDRVSITIPRGWQVEATPEGGQISTDNGSSGEGDPYRIPDIHAVSWLDGGTYLDLEVVGGPATDTDTDDQLKWMNDTCQTFVNCTTGPIQRTTVAGQPALEQVADVNGAMLYLSTLRRGDELIRYRVLSDTALDGGAQARSTWMTLRFSQ